MNISINPYIQTFYAQTLDEVVRLCLQLKKSGPDSRFYFRGENKDFGDGAFTPSIYRNKLLAREHIIYREMQRFNDHEFTTDKTAFDKLARMQHYGSPTRMLDLSEDMFSSLYFALDGRAEDETKDGGVLYVVELNENQIKYYDSDAVSVIANLSKLPYQVDSNASPKEKSKQALWQEALTYYQDRKGYNTNKMLLSKGYLLHDIKEEKSYFKDLIDPKDLFKVVAVKPKLTNQRLQSQKGAFLLFGLSKYNVDEHIKLININGQLNKDSDTHPLLGLTKIKLSIHITSDQLEQLGITMPFIYPELDKVAKYLTPK